MTEIQEKKRETFSEKTFKFKPTFSFNQTSFSCISKLKPVCFRGRGGEVKKTEFKTKNGHPFLEKISIVLNLKDFFDSAKTFFFCVWGGQND